MRGRSLAILAILLAASFSLAPVRADAPLVADAGDSRVAYDGDALPLSGRAIGGVAPYAYAWSWTGDAARILGASDANASFDTSGLAAQDIVFTLTIVDANGAVAADTVRHRVDDAPILARRSVPLVLGVPDELAGGIAGSNLDQRFLSFHVPAGLGRFVAELDWANGIVPYDIDFELVDPAGNVVAQGQGETSARPERIGIDVPAAGVWVARVKPFLNGPTTVNLTVQGFPAATLPRVATSGLARFGSLDAQTLAASTTSGTAPITIEWDLDGDGLFDASGASIASALPVGTRAIRVRATDAVGFEVSATGNVEVVEADTILRLRCGNDASTPFWAMEFTSSRGSCWMHGGHHTYFLGDARYSLRRITGYLFTVEQQFSPPTEYSTDAPGATPIHLQLSEDGQAWTELDPGEYAFLPDVLGGSLALESRQAVTLLATGAEQPFRFVRVYEPLSVAQGLSGYLDHSELDVEADLLGPAPTPSVAPDSRVLDCATGDVIEDFFAAHPCWFGGIDRYDAASFWHTYPLGDGALLDRVSGEFLLAPWRLDDWTQGDALANATNVSAFVQMSVDGVHWTDVAIVPATFGVPTLFDVALDGTPARFVRLFPEYHARFDETAEFAPNHHAKGYFLDSRIVVEGLLPS